MHVEQKVIERILERCRRLRVLKLIRVNYIVQHQQQLGQEQEQEQELQQHLQQQQQQQQVLCFNRASFYTTVAKSCPMLKLFHLSMFDEHMGIEDAQNLIRTFYPGVQLESSVNDEQEHHNAEQTISRPFLDTVSVLDKDINRDTSHILFAPLRDPSFDKIITTLESSRPRARKRLHSHAQRDQIQGLGLSWTTDAANDVCIQELEGRAECGERENDVWIHFNLTWTTTKLEMKDIDWMARYPRKAFGSWLKSKLKTKSEQGLNQAANEFDDHDKKGLVDSIVYAGSEENLEKCQEHISQGMGHMGCLPMLDRLKLQVRLMHKGDIVISTQYLPAMIASVRPDVEFFC
ncbi:hypothetical protein BGZ80_010382 [Entomortierella chlamydospora]|uniref:Uncharacterized protein n=1 Tax=Entomortierella chlamydospora TaxID=101097 RepID=A0A9P6MVY4_9FUNG|nr:hypothetical protein BGZ80_010382 [Entomortierella chlamydospora]